MAKFGYTTVGESIGGSFKDRISGISAISGVAGTITSISVNAGALSASYYGNMKFAIYKDSDKSLVGETEAVYVDVVKTAPEWFTANIISGGTLLASEKYWIVAWSDNYINVSFDVISDDFIKSDYQIENYGSWPDPIVFSNPGGYKYSIYCTFTLSEKEYDVLREDWSDLDPWVEDGYFESTSENAESSISPAGQLYFNLTGLTENGQAHRIVRLPPMGETDYYVKIRFKGDVWDGYVGVEYGIHIRAMGNPCNFNAYLGNGQANGDGIYIVRSDNYIVKAFSKTWSNDFHTVIFYIHNNQTDVDIWVDKDPYTEEPDVTDFNCGFTYMPQWDGVVDIEVFGSEAGNGEYHIDYLYIGDLSIVHPTVATIISSAQAPTIDSNCANAFPLPLIVASNALTPIVKGNPETHTRYKFCSGFPR